MVSLKKQKIVQSLSETLKNSNNFVFLKYNKTTHQALENLRKTLKKTKTSLKVVKNALLEKAIEKISLKNKQLLEFRNNYFPLKEPTALLTFGQDWNTGLKSFYNFSQKDRTITFKFGLLDNEIYAQEGLEKIASLPGRNELAAILIGQLTTPVTRLVFSLKFNTNKLVYILQQKSKKSN